MKTLQEHYNAIKKGQGNKAQFLKQAKYLFPNYLNQYSTYDNAVSVLKSKQIISEVTGGVVAKGFDIWDWKKILAEETEDYKKKLQQAVEFYKNNLSMGTKTVAEKFGVEEADIMKQMGQTPGGLFESTKATEKETSKEVLDNQKNAYNNKDMKNADNVNFNEIMKGFYCEMKDEKNKDKTGDELKAMVVKNLAKDPLYYTKDGMFGVKGVGYTDEAPALGKPKEAKGKYKASGYGDLKEGKTKENTEELIKEQKLRSIIQQIIQEEVDEALYQGPSIKPATGSLGGRRFIPNITALSRDAVDAINAKGLKRLNWEKPHIKVIKSGEGIKLMISKLLLDTIVGAQRGRSKLPLNVSKSGTGITPMETSELTGEFKKLVKVLNADNKLSQTGDYYLLDIDTKYNSERNQFEMPLPKELGETDITGTAGNPEEEAAAKSVQIKKPNPKATTEQKLRSLINNIIKEELNENLKFNQVENI